MDAFAALRFVVGLVFLGYASMSDARTRRVPDSVWVLLGLFSLALLEVQLLSEGSSLEHHLALVPAAIIFFTVFFGEEMWTEKGFRLRPGRLTAYVLAVVILAYTTYHFSIAGGSEADSFWPLLTISILLVLAHVFYQFGLLRGGADAKGLMSIALLVPFYPSLEAGLPLAQMTPSVQHAMDLMFPFALVVLLDAALLLVLLPVVLIVFNASRGDVHGIEALLGYRVSIDKLPKFAWLMDRIENGEHVRVLLPRRREDRKEEVRKLKEKGFDHVWVTPQIPFLIPMTIGFVLAFFLGNFVIGLSLLFT